jgi:hypothetical protein
VVVAVEGEAEGGVVEVGVDWVFVGLQGFAGLFTFSIVFCFDGLNISIYQEGCVDTKSICRIH